jgi:hypothetical protein
MSPAGPNLGGIDALDPEMHKAVDILDGDLARCARMLRALR